MSDQPVPVEVRTDGEIATIILNGHFSQTSENSLNPVMDRLEGEPVQKIVVDLENARALNSVGLGHLLAVYTRAVYCGKKFQLKTGNNLRLTLMMEALNLGFLLES